MKKISIDTIDHPLYKRFEELYQKSFPIFEQRTLTQQLTAFEADQYHLTAFQDQQEQFLGFISYWEFESYIYIEHFAINNALRGKGYGSLILREFIADNRPKITLLEIDPIVDEVSAARLRFYQQSAMHANPYPHTHPAYRPTYQDHSLIVLTSQREITQQEYDRFNQDLAEVIMKK